MGSEIHQLHVLFFPLMAQGHMIPTIDIARLFASRGVKVTILATPLNAPLFSKTVDRDRHLGLEIRIQLIRFPAAEAGLPEGCESISCITSPQMVSNFFEAVNMLEQPFKELVEENRPDCIVADMFFPWATDVAGKLGIPRLVFHGSNFFFHCISDSLKRYEPHQNITCSWETFLVPGLPDQIEMTRSQLPDYTKIPKLLTKLIGQSSESETRSYGVLVNSFYELEPAYAEHYRKVMGRKAWHIGPVSLCNRDITDKAQRGNNASIEEHKCLSWLDSKKPNSVIYVCFGSTSRFTTTQLLEIAMGVEASGHSFIWVVRKFEETKADDEEYWWLPEGFEERIEGKGLLLRGWAPQVLILDHPAVGGFVTHCGWNSTLESVSAGVPMITWPIFAEQFFNEKLVTQVLKIGVAVGVLEWRGSWLEGEKVLVKRGEIEKAVKWLMDGGEEAEQMRSQARELKEMAKRAVEEGGSSYTELTTLIEELRLYKRPEI